MNGEHLPHQTAAACCGGSDPTSTTRMSPLFLVEAVFFSYKLVPVENVAAETKRALVHTVTTHFLLLKKHLNNMKHDVVLCIYI